MIHFGALHYVYLVKRLHRVQHEMVLLHVTILNLGWLEQGTLHSILFLVSLMQLCCYGVACCWKPADQTTRASFPLPSSSLPSILSHSFFRFFPLSFFPSGVLSTRWSADIFAQRNAVICVLLITYLKHVFVSSTFFDYPCLRTSSRFTCFVCSRSSPGREKTPDNYWPHIGPRFAPPVTPVSGNSRKGRLETYWVAIFLI